MELDIARVKIMNFSDHQLQSILHINKNREKGPVTNHLLDDKIVLPPTIHQVLTGYFNKLGDEWQRIILDDVKHQVFYRVKNNKPNKPIPPDDVDYIEAGGLGQAWLIFTVIFTLIQAIVQAIKFILGIKGYRMRKRKINLGHFIETVESIS